MGFKLRILKWEGDWPMPSVIRRILTRGGSKSERRGGDDGSRGWIDGAIS